MSDYHSDRSRISNSQLSKLKESPKEYYAEYILGKRQEATAAMLRGSMVHTLVFEPQEYANEYALSPKCDRRTKDGKELWARYIELSAGKTLIDDNQHDEAERIANAILLHKDFAACMALIDDDAKIEQRIDFDWYGTPSRCKPDLLLPKHKLCVDLKTTADASPDGFAKSVGNFGYHRQQAFYQHAIEQTYGEPFRFLFAVVETKEPYNTAVYELDQTSVDRGANEIDELINELNIRTANNDWLPEYSKGIVPLTLPRWYRSGIYEVTE